VATFAEKGPVPFFSAFFGSSPHATQHVANRAYLLTCTRAAAFNPSFGSAMTTAVFDALRERAFAGREGLQHVSSWEEALDAVVARLKTAGWKIGTAFRFGHDSSRGKGRIEP